MKPPNGVAVVDKPPGMTSHDVVDRARRIFSTKKVGHAGTLDPDATGILVLGVGHATRLLGFAQGGRKRYSAVAQFGTTTSTQDASGEILEEKPVELDRAALEAAAEAFLGEIEQIPPMVSAVKVGGEPLYKKARRGEEIERQPRPVTIHVLRVTSFDEAAGLASLDVTCSPGTYVRTLMHDLGQAVGCGAHLVSLRRTEASGFTEADAVPLDTLSPDHLRPPLEILRGLPQMSLDPHSVRLVADGRPLPLTDDDLTEEQQVALVTGDRLLGVYRRRGSQLVADKVLPT